MTIRKIYIIEYHLITFALSVRMRQSKTGISYIGYLYEYTFALLGVPKRLVLTLDYAIFAKYVQPNQQRLYLNYTVCCTE